MVGYHSWLTGCDTCSVQPQKMKDGKVMERDSFDVNRLKLIKKAKVKLTPQIKEGKKKSGGPQKHPDNTKTI